MSGSAADLPLLLVGGLATLIFVCGALAQIAVGRLVEGKFPPHILFAVIASLQFLGVLWGGAIHRQGADRGACRGHGRDLRASHRQRPRDRPPTPPTPGAARIYAVALFPDFSRVRVRRWRRFAFLHGRGRVRPGAGPRPATIALGFVFRDGRDRGCWSNGVEKGRTRVVAPAE